MNAITPAKNWGKLGSVFFLAKRSSSRGRALRFVIICHILSEKLCFWDIIALSSVIKYRSMSYMSRWHSHHQHGCCHQDRWYFRCDLTPLPTYMVCYQLDNDIFSIFFTRQHYLWCSPCRWGNPQAQAQLDGRKSRRENTVEAAWQTKPGLSMIIRTLVWESSCNRGDHLFLVGAV